MGLLDRLRGWLRGLLGREPRGSGDDGDGTPEYRCAVCGTAVEDPDGECPLCRSTDIVAGEAGSDGAGSATEHAAAADPATETKLGDVLEEGPLEQHADRWERVDGGYRIERPDGGIERVDSRGEARAVLARLYG